MIITEPFLTDKEVLAQRLSLEERVHHATNRKRLAYKYLTTTDYSSKDIAKAFGYSVNVLTNVMRDDYSYSAKQRMHFVGNGSNHNMNKRNWSDYDESEQKYSESWNKILYTQKLSMETT